MCKYCRDNNKTPAIGQGKIISFCGIRGKSEWRVNLKYKTIIVNGCTFNHSHWFKASIPINYCPYCGKKL